MNGSVSTGLMIAYGRKHFRICKPGLEFGNGTKGYFITWFGIIGLIATPMMWFIIGVLCASILI